jgi:hypothetical protein
MVLAAIQRQVKIRFDISQSSGEELCSADTTNMPPGLGAW